jgi:acetyl esterase
MRTKARRSRRAFVARAVVRRRKINVDGKTLGIVGNSVGGNMTAVVALIAKGKGGSELKCQILFWPVTNANLENV